MTREETRKHTIERFQAGDKMNAIRIPNHGYVTYAVSFVEEVLREALKDA